jgi:predicted DNA-binding protein
MKNVRITGELEQKLARVVKRTGRNQSDITREALTQLFRRDYPEIWAAQEGEQL